MGDDSLKVCDNFSPPQNSGEWGAKGILSCDSLYRIPVEDVAHFFCEAKKCVKCLPGGHRGGASQLMYITSKEV